MDDIHPPAPDPAPAVPGQSPGAPGQQNGHDDAPDHLVFAGTPAVPVARRPRARSRGRAWPGWERLTRLLLAFTIASLLWFYVLNSENPATSTTYTLIPVTSRGLSQNLNLGNDLGSVTISVQAPTDVLAGMRPADFSPYVDLSGKGPGTYTVPVQVAAPGNVLSATAEPSQVQVQVIEVSTKTYTVQVRVQGVPALGYRVDTPQVRPTTVQVRGPGDQMARINQVVADLNVQDRQGTLQGDVQPRAVDFAGNEIPGLEFNPQSVTVVIAIQQLLNLKTLPIHVPVEGAPAPGYAVTDIVVQPTTLTASGSPTQLEPLNFLETAPVSVDGATQSVQVTVAVSLTKGLTLYPPNTANRVQVNVQIAALTTKTQLSVQVQHNGLAPGLVSIASPDRVDVTVSGPFNALQDFKPDSVQAVVDLTGYGVGTYRISPVINLPPSVTVVDTSPAAITVTITTEATPTLEPSATPTVTPTALPASPGLPETVPPAPTLAAEPATPPATPSATPVASASAVPAVVPTVTPHPVPK